MGRKIVLTVLKLWLLRGRKGEGKGKGKEKGKGKGKGGGNEEGEKWNPRGLLECALKTVH